MPFLLNSNGRRLKVLPRLLCVPARLTPSSSLVPQDQCPLITFGDFGDFGDFGVSDVATVAWRYTRRGGPRLSVQGEPLVVLTRGP